MKLGDGFIRHGSLMFLAVAVSHILSLLYQLYMVRNLSPVHYGVLNSLFSILVMVSVSSGTLQIVVTRFVSMFYTMNHHDGINLLLQSLSKKTFVFGLAIFLMLVIGSRSISFFLQIDSPLLVVMLGLMAFFSIILPITQGGLQGLQRFGYLGLTMIANGGLKLIFGIVFISIGLGVKGAMGALVLSTFLSLLLSFILFASVLPGPLASISELMQFKPNKPDNEMNVSGIYRYVYAVATVFLCFMILTNIDVLLIKHFFDPLEAGYYSIAQMVGKIILYLPVAITLVMFPKASSLHSQAKDTLHLLKKSLLCVGVLCGIAALICLLFPGLIIRLLSGKEHVQCVPLARIFSVTMVFFALVYVLLFYNLSIHRLGFIYSLVLLTVLQVLAIILFHKSLSHVLWIMCGNAVLLFLINAYMAFERKGLNATFGINSNS